MDHQNQPDLVQVATQVCVQCERLSKDCYCELLADPLVDELRHLLDDVRLAAAELDDLILAAAELVARPVDEPVALH